MAQVNSAYYQLWAVNKQQSGCGKSILYAGVCRCVSNRYAYELTADRRVGLAGQNWDHSCSSHNARSSGIQVIVLTYFCGRSDIILRDPPLKVASDAVIADTSI